MVFTESTLASSLLSKTKATNHRLDRIMLYAPPVPEARHTVKNCQTLLQVIDYHITMQLQRSMLLNEESMLEVRPAKES